MDIFISYSRADKKEAKQFCKAFKDEGWSVWIDLTGIESGDEFKHKITEAIESCKVFVFLSSKNSNESRWVANEIGVATALEKPVIPVKLDGAKYNKQVLMDLVNIDFIDYTHDKEEGMAKLLSSLRNKIGPGKKADVQPAAPANKKPGKRTGLAIAIAAVVCVVIGAVALLFPTIGRRADVSPALPVKSTVPVEINSVPSGALLALADTNVRWVAPAVIELKPGKEYTVTASLDGYSALSEKFTVKDSLNVLTLTLQKKKAAAPAATASAAQPKATESQWLPATGVFVGGYLPNDKPTDRGSRIKYLRGGVTFINKPDVKKSTVTVYMMVDTPEGKRLTNSQSGTFTYNGKKMKYSARQSVEYDGTEVDVDIYFRDIQHPTIKDSLYVFQRGIYNAVFCTSTQELGKAEMLIR